MPDELAVYLGSAERVRALRDIALNTCADGAPVRGGDLAAELAEQLPAALQAPFLWLLVNEGIAKRLEGAASIEGYLLSVNTERLREYLNEEAKTAEVLERAEARVTCSKGTGRQVEVIATLPPGLFPDKQAGTLGSIEPAIRKIIASGRERVWIVNPFFDPFGLSSLLPSISGAIDRGVSVRLLTRATDGKWDSLFAAVMGANDDANPPDFLSRLEVRSLVKKDEVTGRLQYALHSKVVLADSTICYIGSANVTEHGLRHNFELGVVIRGETVATVLSLLERLWDISIPVCVRP